MNILLINLPESVDRLNFQKKQLKQLGLDFEVLVATSRNELSQEEIQNLSYGWERPLRSSELACFMSHKNAWLKVQESQEPTLILEDDALLSIHTPALLNTLSQSTNRDLITLEVRGRKKVVAKQAQSINTDFNQYRLYQDRTGAAGYILWPSGAKKLLNKASNFPPALADAFISSCYTLNAYQVEPAAIIQLDQCDNYQVPSQYSTTSHISSQRKPQPKLPPFSYTLFKLRRIKAQLKMGVRQLWLRRVSQRRAINLIRSQFIS